MAAARACVFSRSAAVVGAFPSKTEEGGAALAEPRCLSLLGAGLWAALPAWGGSLGGEPAAESIAAIECPAGEGRDAPCMLAVD